MSRILFVDPVGGAAGDMLLAALLDAGASEDAVRQAIEAVLPDRFVVHTDTVRRAEIRARRLRVDPGPNADAARVGPRRLGDLLAVVDRAALSGSIRAAARSVLEKLAWAEARVHGVDPTEVELHQLGDDDTLLDVVGVAAALESLGIERLLVSSLPLGEGRLETMPLPAPATLELLRGFEIRTGTPGETVTPTAAAILSALGEPAGGIPPMALESVGYGAGMRDTASIPNVVRVLVGTSSDRGPLDETGPLLRDLVVLEANLDDLTPELVADAVQALFAAGAVDAWVTPVMMKKGRPGFILSALTGLEAEAALTRVFFDNTSTFGVRASSVRRAELARRIVSVAVAEGEVRVKVGLLGSRVMTATPEHDDVVELARSAGRPVRDVYEEAAVAARALRFEAVEG